jgi:hypothetical protein
MAAPRIAQDRGAGCSYAFALGACTTGRLGEQMAARLAAAAGALERAQEEECRRVGGACPE